MGACDRGVEQGAQISLRQTLDSIGKNMADVASGAGVEVFPPGTNNRIDLILAYLQHGWVSR
jgi:hypothetical protein